MADAAFDDKQTRDEAAGWYAKLNNTTISTETLRAFREWRNADERRAEAYAEIEAFWRRAGELVDDHEIQRAAGEALARSSKAASGPLSKLGRRGLAGLIVGVAIGGAGLFAWHGAAGKVYATGTGEQRIVTLSDGSRLKLDAESRVRARLTSDARSLELMSGRALFEVAHDQKRPFVVKAGEVSITALGTRFEVRREASSTLVTLIEGKVEVDDAASAAQQSWRLGPGDQVKLGAPRAPATLSRVDTDQTTAWTTGRLIFRSEDLAVAVAEVNRYGDDHVVLSDASLAGRKITGAFDAGDTTSFVAALRDLYDLRVEKHGNEIRLAPAA